MTGTVIQNRKILPGAELYELTFTQPEAAATALPGQFLHIACGEALLLRRPISICNTDDDRVTVCYDVRGKGTAYLSALKAGDIIDILPPQGHGFTVSDEGRALLIGGGIGIYPLVMLADRYGGRADAALGFRSEQMVNMTDCFSALCSEMKYITDDRGFVTQLAAEMLESGAYAVIHACGPKPMLKGAAALAERYGIRCEVSLEERMACGIGACMGCVCKIKDGNGGFKNKRVCADGPVFDASEVIWE